MKIEKREVKSVLKHIVLGVALLVLATAAWTQRSVLALPDDNGVWIRWTSPDLKSNNGIKVYRQEGTEGAWTLLNETAFAYGQADIGGLLAQNKRIQNAKDMADAMRKAGKMEGMGLALVLTTAVESREFSNYLGIIYLDKSAQAGKEYRYEVKEVAGLAETSYGQSPVVKAGKLVPSAPPADIKTKIGDTKLFFSWNPEQKRLTGAHVYYKIGGGGWQRFNKYIILPSTVAQDNGEEAFPEWLFFADSLQNGTTYTCMLKGVDLFGFETAPSAEFKLTPLDKTPPAQPTTFELKAVDDKVMATWDLPKPKGVEGFNLYRATGNDTTFVKLNKQLLPASLRRYEETVEETAANYTYAIATVDKAGNENRNEAFIRISDSKPPVMVRNLKAVADTGVIKLTWFPNPEKDLKGYLIYRMARTAAGGDTIQLTSRPFVSNSYNDTLPKIAKNQFVYFVTAVDTEYNASPLSAPATAVLPDPEPPEVPFLKEIRREAESLKLVWLPGLEIDLAGFIVYRSTKEKGPDSIWKPLMDRPLGPKDTSYADRTIEVGQTYFYTVQALDNAGNRSEMSDPFSGSVTAMKLKAIPQDIVVKHAKGKSEASLTWKLPDGAAVIGCMVYRKQGKDAFLPISGLVTDYKVADHGLKRGETYYYEIRAFDKAGNFAKSAPIRLTIEAE